MVSVASIRKLAQGIGSEFALECDMRFASREHAILGRPAVAVGVEPGGGAVERLARLVGRGRALEILLGGNDFDALTAERYGWVNRAVPDEQLEDFVDRFALRAASFDRWALAHQGPGESCWPTGRPRAPVESAGIRLPSGLAGNAVAWGVTAPAWTSEAWRL